MASWQSSFESVQSGVEEVTVDDLNIIVMDSGSELEDEVEEEALALVKPECEEVEDWQLMYCTKSASPPFLLLSSTSDEEDSQVGVPLTTHEDILDAGGAAIDQFQQADSDVELEQQQEDNEEQTEAVAAPICSYTPELQRPLEGSASGFDLWQRYPGPPAVMRRHFGRQSPAWEFFEVPVGSNKATADIVRCRLCHQEVSRGIPSRVNQTRGTLSMLRHLYIHHWDDMTADFQVRYKQSRSRALHGKLFPEDQTVEDESVGGPLPSTSAQASGSCPEPVESDPWPDQAGQYVTFCVFCDRIVLGRNMPYVHYKGTLRQHSAVCFRQ